MFKKLSRKYCLEKYPQFPQSYHEKKISFFPKTCSYHVLMIPSDTLNGYSRRLAAEIIDLVQYMQATSLIFLGDTEVPWLYQQHDYKPVKNALQYLSQKKVGKKFSGGFEIGGTDLHAFLAHLFWLVRCNTVLPIVYFIDKDQRFIGCLCQYGNIHFSTMDKQANLLLKAALKKSALRILNDNCLDQFSKTGKIKGRKIVL
jgi:hypothetical protein